MPGDVIKVMSTKGEGEAPEEIGQIRFGEEGMLELISAHPDHEATLAYVIGDTNGRDALRLKEPPPPDEDRYSLYALDVDRTAPDLFKYMLRFLSEYHGLTVVADT